MNKISNDTFSLKSCVIVKAYYKSSKYGEKDFEFAEWVGNRETAIQCAERRAEELRLLQFPSYDSIEVWNIRVDQILINDVTGEESTISRRHI